MQTTLYAGTLFVSAMLLFWLQPMFSKMALPLLGGTPGVWNTCMVFYQAALLAGYAAAHAFIGWLGVKRQAALHLFILGIGFFFLPITLSNHSLPSGQPILWLLGLLAVSIGWPFWAVSATAPMLQRWFSDTNHERAHDPYFLYSASNLGSLAALLGYPILIEPYLRLSQQTWAWSAGYALLFVLTFTGAVVLWRSPAKIESIHEEENDRETIVSHSDRLRWFALSLIPSSMLLGVTTYVTTDVAAVPLLWVAPLAIYLGSFVLVFARRKIVRHSILLRIQPYLLAPPVVLFFWGSKVPIAVNFSVHFIAFFVHAMVCHGELAKRRPSANRLTEFYLWMAAGGVAGGSINAIAAPFLFLAPLEYPLAIAAAAMLRSRTNRPKPRAKRFAYGLLAGLAVLLMGPLMGDPDIVYNIGILGLLIVTSLFAAYFFAWIDRPTTLGILFALFIVVGFRLNDGVRKVLHRERGFFGPLLVRMDPEERFYLFYHGTTLHGAQSRAPGERMKPLTYFTESGPFGQIVKAFYAERPQPVKIAVTGLGAGTIAAYGRFGDAIDYYEIDPNVERIARNDNYFTFLQETPANATVTLGDARLTLAQAPDRSYDLIVMDAFSSGSIPIHLLTREAFAVLQSKLKPGGILVYQITNRCLNLEPVLASLASEAGWTALVKRNLDVSPEEKLKMIDPSVWTVVAQPCEILDALSKEGWEGLLPTPGFTTWTDDFSNILSVVKAPKWD